MNRFYAHNGILQCDSGKIARHVWQAADRAQLHESLLNCHSVNEVANYLKNRTAYADIFEGTTTTDIHRGQLETMLKKRVFDQYASLCRYEMSIGQDFYQYLSRPQRYRPDYVLCALLKHWASGRLSICNAGVF